MPDDPSHILVVEDDEDSRELLAEFLLEQGFEVTSVETAESGLALLRQRRFELVLTDYQLPGEDGVWMLKQAEQEGLLAHCRAMILTAQQSLPAPDDVRVMHKPLDLTHLLEAVEAECAAVQRLRSPESRKSQLPRDDAAQQPELYLFVVMPSQASERAERTVRQTLVAGGFDPDCLRLVDIGSEEGRAHAARERVAFTPSLLRASPLPRRWIIGDLRRSAIVRRLLAQE